MARRRRGALRKGRLTAYQRQLLQELGIVAEITEVNFRGIFERNGGERTAVLRLMRDRLVRGFVINRYTLVDEFLGSEVCHYFFPRRNFIRLWRTQRFRRFNHYILETMSLLEKLRLVRAIRELPKSDRSNIEALNALRNGLAHAFFPENLRAGRPVWKGLNIFSVEGLRRFAEDMQEVIETLAARVYGRHRRPRALASALANVMEKT